MKSQYIVPCPKHNRKCNAFIGYNDGRIGFNGNHNGVYYELFWWSVVWQINNFLNNAQNTLKKEFCNDFDWKS